MVHNNDSTHFRSSLDSYGGDGCATDRLRGRPSIRFSPSTRTAQAEIDTSPRAEYGGGAVGNLKGGELANCAGASDSLVVGFLTHTGLSLNNEPSP
jgi:hypothetical protein